MIENQKILIDILKTTVSTGAAPTLSNNNGFKGSTGTLTGWPLLTTKCWNTIPISAQCMPVVEAWKTWVSPNIEVRTNGFKVCNTDGSYWRCDASCTWTVPTGVTSAQFQLWGPGGSNSSQCCCGGTPPGPSGAYMLVKMNVTAGDVYTLCAGCSYCCWASQTTPGLSSSASYITGPGLSVCALPGIGCAVQWSTDVGALTNAANNFYPSQDTCAPTMCSGFNFCWDTGADDMWVPHSFSSTAQWCVKCTDTSKSQTYWGVQGLWPAMCLSTGGMSSWRAITTPVVGFETAVMDFDGFHQAYGGGYSYGGCYHNAANGYLRIPGAGGTAQYALAGTGATGGDNGRFGMVCVSW